MADMTFTIPRNLWHSLNRYPTNRAHLSRLRRDLHDLAWAQSFTAGFKAPGILPVALTWEVSYPAGTTEENGDPVNAAPVTKALLDGLVSRAKILPNDGPSVVLDERFTRGPNRPKKDDPHQIRLHMHPLTTFNTLKETH